MPWCRRVPLQEWQQLPLVVALQMLGRPPLSLQKLQVATTDNHQPQPVQQQG
jgi:hypothetical protein